MTTSHAAAPPLPGADGARHHRAARSTTTQGETVTTITNKAILALALVAALASLLAFAGSALADRGGNAANAKLCQKAAGRR